MKGKDELKESDIKNCRCYYFDDIMIVWVTNIDTNFSNFLLDEELYKEKTKSFRL